MAPAAVVEALDVFDDRPAGCGAGRPGPGIDQLAFEGGEEALGEDVMPALAGPAQGERHLVVVGEVSELS